MGTDTIVSRKSTLWILRRFLESDINEIWDFKFCCSFNDGPRAIQVFGIWFLGSEACTAWKSKQEGIIRPYHVWFTFCCLAFGSASGGRRECNEIAWRLFLECSKCQRLTCMKVERFLEACFKTLVLAFEYLL